MVPHRNDVSTDTCDGRRSGLKQRPYCALSAEKERTLPHHLFWTRLHYKHLVARTHSSNVVTWSRLHFKHRPIPPQTRILQTRTLLPWTVWRPSFLGQPHLPWPMHEYTTKYLALPCWFQYLSAELDYGQHVIDGELTLAVILVAMPLPWVVKRLGV